MTIRKAFALAALLSGVASQALLAAEPAGGYGQGDPFFHSAAIQQLLTAPTGDGATVAVRNSTLTAKQIYSGNLLPNLPGFSNFDNIRSVLNLQPATSVTLASVVSGGSGGTNGTNVNLTVTGGTCSVQPIIQGTISGGALTAITGYSRPGTCSALPSNPAAVTGGGLSGATVHIYAGNIVNAAYNAYCYDNIDFIVESYGVSCVNYKSTGVAAADGAAVWAHNWNLIDSPTTTLSQGVRRQLNGAEADWVITSPDTIAQGPSFNLQGPAQPRGSNGLQFTGLGTTGTLSNITISDGAGGVGTVVSATVVSGAATIANGNLIEGGSVVVGTRLSNVSVSGGVLTATASIAQNTSGTTGLALTDPVTAELTNISISGNNLTATVVAGKPVVGNILDGAGILPNTFLANPVVTAGTLTSVVSNSQTVVSLPSANVVSQYPLTWNNAFVISPGGAQNIILSQYLPAGNLLHSPIIHWGTVDSNGAGHYTDMEVFPIGTQPGLEIYGETTFINGLVFRPAASGSPPQIFPGGPNGEANVDFELLAVGTGNLISGSSWRPLNLNSNAQSLGTSSFPWLATYSQNFVYGLIYSAAGTALPTCNTGAKGTAAMVSDATAPTYHGAYTSGGAVVSPVFCNGSNWLTI